MKYPKNILPKPKGFRPPITLALPESDKLMVVENWEVDVPYKDDIIHVEVEHSFIYDGMSIPPIAWWLAGTPFEPRHIAPGAGHDKGYRESQGYPREIWDYVMYVLLIWCGETPRRSKRIYRAVRHWGWKAWNSHRKA